MFVNATIKTHDVEVENISEAGNDYHIKDLYREPVPGGTADRH